jgi:hypothetical protein
MKNEIRLALLCLAAASVPAFAQSATPLCGSTNFDRTRNVFTITKPAGDAVNQQCFITVYPKGAMPDQARQDPMSYLEEGTYTIDLSGGGGGGGGGGTLKDASAKGGVPSDEGGGGGGAGAVPSRTVQYLAPGVYKLTIGTGGSGGSASGGRTEAGNPTSLTNVYTGQLIAGFPGADTWTQQTTASGGGAGGVAAAGGVSGTSGGTGRAGDAGGSGGASRGSGGAGESVSGRTAAGTGDLGGGGGGGRGGANTADAGGEGGHGFIKLTMAERAPQASAPAAAPQTIASAPAMSSSSESGTTPARAATRAARKDRN